MVPLIGVRVPTPQPQQGRLARQVKKRPARNRGAFHSVGLSRLCKLVTLLQRILRIRTVLPEQREALPTRYNCVGQERGERGDVNDDHDHRHIWEERHDATLEPTKHTEREVFGPTRVKKLAFASSVKLTTFKHLGSFVQLVWVIYALNLDRTEPLH